MKTIQKHWSKSHGWQSLSGHGGDVQLVLAFGAIDVLRQTVHIEEIRSSFPNAHLVGCSTAGEIMGDQVFDDSLAVTGVAFQNSTVQCADTTVNGIADSFDAGARLANTLDPNSLVHVLVLSAGLNVSGSALADGLHSRLPAHVATTGGLFSPLSLRLEGSNQRLVRTIQAINKEDGSMTFTGDIPEGGYARLMKGNFERLLDGAAESARQAQIAGAATPPLALLISCVGRKLVLKQRIDEEVESVRDVLGPDAAIAGFYSYGEICPVEAKDKHAELHNQTMTVTTISERRN